MKLSSANALRASLLFLAGVAAGGFVSDVAAVHGFPQGRYLVTLKHESSAEADYRCMKIGATLGDNFSEFDKARGSQVNCVLGLTGAVLPDGSFTASTGSFLWAGRLGLTQHVRIDAAQIEKIRAL